MRYRIGPISICRPLTKTVNVTLQRAGDCGFEYRQWLTAFLFSYWYLCVMRIVWFAMTKLISTPYSWLPFTTYKMVSGSPGCRREGVSRNRRTRYKTNQSGSGLIRIRVSPPRPRARVLLSLSVGSDTCRLIESLPTSSRLPSTILTLTPWDTWISITSWSPKSYPRISVMSGCGYVLPASRRDKPHPAIDMQGWGLGSKYSRLSQMLCIKLLCLLINMLLIAMRFHMFFIILFGDRFEICQSILYIGGVVRERCDLLPGVQ